MALRWSDTDREQLLNQHGEWLALADGEQVEFAAKTVRDMLILTDRRLIRTDTQGLVNRKVEYLSIPYKGVTRWSVESKGRGWRDGADLKIWLSSMEKPILDVELQKDESAREVAALMSRHLL
jgi:hypothetical protein